MLTEPRCITIQVIRAILFEDGPCCAGAHLSAASLGTEATARPPARPPPRPVRRCCVFAGTDPGWISAGLLEMAAPPGLEGGPADVDLVAHRLRRVALLRGDGSEDTVG